MSILIVSMPADAHALAVKWALESKGEQVSLLCWSDYPQRYGGSFRVVTNEPSSLTLTSGEGVDSIPSNISVIWNHRTTPFVPHPEIALADHAPISEAASWFQRGVISHFERNAFAVNPSRSKWYFDNKLNQLHAARECGFRVPETLISNDYDSVRAFLSQHGGGIVKPLKYLDWYCGDKVVSLFTTAIDHIDNILPVAVAACPMIYQEKIEKAFEYRVVVLGREIRAFRLGSQEDGEAALDWRIIDYRHLPISSCELPDDLIARIFKFMDFCGLVAGSFDFAVQPDGEIVFFEVNETGQFLWLEEQCPEIPLLDMFASFLQHGAADFHYRPLQPPIAFAEWRRDFRTHMAADRRRHVPVNLDKRFPDTIPETAS